MCITFRIKRHRDDASSSTEIRLKVDTTRSGEECGESSFDVTTYLLVDRPTHPYKQGLLERNRNNLYPKGLGSDRVSLGYYLPAVRFAVCMYVYTRVRGTVTWLEHFRSTRTRGVCAFCVAFEESIDRGCLPRPLRVFPPSLFPYRPSRLRVPPRLGFGRRSKRELERNLISIWSKHSRYRVSNRKLELVFKNPLIYL